MNWIEIFGYFGSALIAFSLMMSNIIKLRVINFTGAVIFSIYGLLLDSYPVFFLNFFIAMINVFFLYKLFNEKDRFDLIDSYDNNPLLKKFYTHFEKDIKKIFPSFNTAFKGDYKCILTFRNLTLSGIFLYTEQNGVLEIVMDYVSPQYRDFRNSEFIYKLKTTDFSKRGIKKLTAQSTDKQYSGYLVKAGFKNINGNIFEKEI
jgi:hypothetical protein